MTMMEQLKSLKLGLLLAVLSLVYGFGLGIVFGAAEDSLKGHLKSEGEAALEQVYAGDRTKMEKTVAKSWVYFKRAHLHANGIGTTAVALILVLGALGCRCGASKLASFGLGFGALFYSVYWMLAGLRAPGMGGTHEAKESLDWLAIPSSGLAVLGVLITLWMVIRCCYGASSSS